MANTAANRFVGQIASDSEGRDDHPDRHKANYQASGVHVKVDGSLSLRPWPTTHYWRVKALFAFLLLAYSTAFSHFIFDGMVRRIRRPKVAREVGLAVAS